MEYGVVRTERGYLKGNWERVDDVFHQHARRYPEVDWVTGVTKNAASRQSIMVPH